MQHAASYRTFTRESLAEELGVSPRMVTRWVGNKVIPPPHGANRWRYYDDRHLAAGRRLLREVYDARVTLAEFRERLHGAS